MTTSNAPQQSRMMGFFNHNTENEVKSDDSINDSETFSQVNFAKAPTFDYLRGRFEQLYIEENAK